MRIDEDTWLAIGWGAVLLAMVLLGLATEGCTVRSVTVCATYDRALRRPDPALGYSRDAAGASACVETGPREQPEQ